MMIIIFIIFIIISVTLAIGHFVWNWFGARSSSKKYWMCDWKKTAKCIPCPDNKKCTCAPEIKENKKFNVKGAPAVATCTSKETCEKHCPGWYCTGVAS